MGEVHPFIVVGRVGGRLRPLASLYLIFADVGKDMLEVTSRILLYLNNSQRYIDLELAWAETLPHKEWSRPDTVKVECRLRSNEMWKLKEDCSKNRDAIRIEELEAEIKRFTYEYYLPKFPMIQTCLLLGAISSSRDSWYLHNYSLRPWNSAPNWGGKGMWEQGCTVINLTDRSYAFVLPAEKTWPGGEDQPDLSLQPISGHQWLSAFGLHNNDPEEDDIWIHRSKAASVISEGELQELWPCFLQDERNHKGKDKDSKYEGTEEIIISNNEENPKNGNAGLKVFTSQKRKREPESQDEHVVNIIDQMLKSSSTEQLKASENFLPELERYTREHPDCFAAENQGAVSLLLTVILGNGKRYIEDIKLDRFKALSGDQVVKLISAVITRNTEMRNGEKRPLDLLDLSFNASVTLDHLRCILDLTDLKELLIWDNPALPLEEIAKVADGRIAKVTTRAGFLAPWERWVWQRINMSESSSISTQPLIPTAPTRIRIRQVVWMMLATQNVDNSKSLTRASLENFDSEMLATILHPQHHNAYSDPDPNHIFAELIAFPHHDMWTPLAEFYSSLEDIVIFMSNQVIIEHGHNVLVDRWPLIFPLMMATGSVKSDWEVTSPLPAEAFHHAMLDGQSGQKTMRTDGPAPIIYGEYTFVFLREPDFGRLRLGLVTRDAAGQLEVHDPAAVADKEAVEVWNERIGRLPAWTSDRNGEPEDRDRRARYKCDTMLLDVAAIETIWAAARKLAAQENEQRSLGGYRGPLRQFSLSIPGVIHI